jgi:hypothetical protein
MDANGFYGAIIAQRSTGYILAGNHRYRAAVERDAETVPVIWVDVDDDSALRILLADNRTADGGDYDAQALVDILADMGNLEGTGYDAAAVEEWVFKALNSTEVEGYRPGSTGTENPDGPTRVNNGRGDGLTYALVFATSDEQEAWGRFIRGLRDKYPDEAQIGSRVIRFLREAALESRD